MSYVSIVMVATQVDTFARIQIFKKNEYYFNFLKKGEKPGNLALYVNWHNPKWMKNLG